MAKKKASKKRFEPAAKGLQRKDVDGRRAPRPSKRTATGRRPASKPLLAPPQPLPAMASMEHTVTVEAPVERVWDVLAQRLSEWWPGGFSALANSEKMVLEPWAGGRLYERGTGGAELLWANVLTVVPNRTLLWVGHIAPGWGGPSLSYAQFALSPAGEGRTEIAFTDTVMGRVDAATRASISDGWRFLLEKALKGFVEGKGRSFYSRSAGT